MKTKDMALIGLFAALLAICSWISIPTTIPFTLQTMGVFLAVGLLGGKRGTISILLYLLIGAIGVPVFSGFKGGIGALAGPTGGYLIGFVGTALIMWLFTARFGSSTKVLFLSMILGLMVCYCFGTLWFMWIYNRTQGAISLMGTLSACVFPFIIPDLIKMAVAILLINRLRPIIK
jgi:biotin transport system substrate-specific component